MLSCSLRAADKDRCRDDSDCLAESHCSAGICEPKGEPRSCIGGCGQLGLTTCRDVFAYGEGTDTLEITTVGRSEIRGTGGMQGTGHLYFTSLSGTGYMYVSDPRSVDGQPTLVVSAWIKPVLYRGWQRVVGQYGRIDVEQERGAYALYMGPGADAGVHDSLRFRVSTGPNLFTSVGGGKVPLNTWTHVLGRYTGSALELYVNGALVGTEPLSGALYDSKDGQPLGIGATLKPNGEAESPFEGELDEIFVGTNVQDSSCMATCRDIFAYGEDTDIGQIETFGAAAIHSSGGQQGTGQLYSTDLGYMRVDNATRVEGQRGLVVSAWIKPQSYVDYARLVARYSWPGPGEQAGAYMLSMSPGSGEDHDRLSFRVATGNGAFDGVTGGQAPLDLWTHVLGRYDGNAVQLYVNGVLADAKALTGPLRDDGSHPLGLFTSLKPNGVPENRFRGALDEVFIGTNAADYRSCMP